MGEQVFDLDLKIDDKFWSNFSSHPSRNSSFFGQQQSSTSSNKVEKEIKKEEPAPKKTPEEIIQSNQPLDDKMTALFQGDFKIDKQTKPSYHLLMDFEDKEGVPLILAKPSFTRQDVEKYFENLERPKVLPPLVVPIQPVIVTEAIKESVPPQVVETPLPTTQVPPADLRPIPQEIPEPVPQPIPETIPQEIPQPTVVAQEERREYIEREIDSQERLRTEYTEDGILKTRIIENIPDNELEARSLQVIRRYEEEKPVVTPQQEEEVQPTIAEEARAQEVPVVSAISEKRIEEEVAAEVPYRKVRLDGQILGNTLLRKLSFDSFHYVKIQPWREDQTFLFDRFVKRTKFSKYINEINAKHGANHLIKSYFNEGILKSPYLIERYFRNPFIYTGNK